MWIFNFYLNILSDQIKYILVDSNIIKNLSPLSVRSGWKQKLFCVSWSDKFSLELRASLLWAESGCGSDGRARWRPEAPGESLSPAGLRWGRLVPSEHLALSGGTFNFHDRGAESCSWLLMGRSLRKGQNQDGSALPYLFPETACVTRTRGMKTFTGDGDLGAKKLARTKPDQPLSS